MVERGSEEKRQLTSAMLIMHRFTTAGLKLNTADLESSTLESLQTHYANSLGFAVNEYSEIINFDSPLS